MKAATVEVFKRSFKLLCPACGQSRIFETYYVLYQNCPSCGLALHIREPNTWFFMYVSTAAITGVFFLLMLLFKSSNPALARILLIGLATLTFFTTLPLRKSVAIALDYLSPQS